MNRSINQSTHIEHVTKLGVVLTTKFSYVYFKTHHSIPSSVCLCLTEPTELCSHVQSTTLNNSPWAFLSYTWTPLSFGHSIGSISDTFGCPCIAFTFRYSYVSIYVTGIPPTCANLRCIIYINKKFLQNSKDVGMAQNYRNRQRLLHGGALTMVCIYTCKIVTPFSPTSLNVGTMVNAPLCNSLYLFLSSYAIPTSSLLL